MKNHRLFFTLCLVGAFSVLAACASKSQAPVVERGASTQPGHSPAGPVSPAEADAYYTVKKGETLYGISLDHGLNYRDVAAWNNLDERYSLRTGQQLRIRPPGTNGTGSSDGVAVAQPITAGGGVETRSLDGSVISPPSTSSPVTGAGGIKREPKSGKEPYSDEALAQAQKPTATTATTAATTVATTTATAATSDPASGSDSKTAESKSADGDSGDEVGWIWPANGKVVATFNEATNKGVDIAGKAGDPVLAAGTGKVVYSGTGLRGYGKLVIVKHNATYLSAYAHNQTILVKEGQSVARGQKIAEMGNTDADQVKLHFEIRRQGKPTDPMKYLPPR